MSNNQFKQLADRIWDEIQNADRILLHCHVNPDEDSIGSALATYHTLKSIGKDVTVIQGDGAPLPNLKHLPGLDQITTDDYFSCNIDTYDLFIVLDSASPSRISKNGDVVFPETLRTVAIDHHETNEKFCDINLVDTQSASTSAILYDLFTTWNIPVTQEIASCLMVGLYGDTVLFMTSSTNAQTFATANALANIDPQVTKDGITAFSSKTPNTLALQGHAFGSIDTFLGGIAAATSVSYDFLTDNNITHLDIEQALLANTLITVAEWVIGINLIEIMPRNIRVNLRSRDPERYDISQIARALGGGGHKGAAGILLEDIDLATARTKIQETIEATFTH